VLAKADLSAAARTQPGGECARPPSAVARLGELDKADAWLGEMQRRLQVPAGVYRLVAGACERNSTLPSAALCKCGAPEPLLPFRMLQWQEAQAKVARPKPTVDSVLIGDSILFHMRGKLDASRYLDLGWSSDTAQNMIWRLQARQPWLEIPNPRVVMVMAGTNNIGDEEKELANYHELVQARGADDAACGVRALLGQVRRAWPSARVVLHAVLPRTREEKVPARVAPLNFKLRGVVEELEDVDWLDCSRVFLNSSSMPDGALYNDNVHPSPEGYARWMGCLLPQLEALH